MKNSKLKYVILYLLTLIPIAITMIYYNQLPDKYPIHWNVQGQVDNYGSRSSSLITACIPIIFVLAMQFMPRIDPRKKNYDNFKSSYFTFQLMFAVFMGAIHIITLLAALGNEIIKVDTGVKLLVALLFTVIGNIMPKFKHNYFIGIKTPWTLANEDIWFSTHRVGGKLWFYSGLLMVVLAFIPGNISAGIYFAAIFGSSLFSVVYSYLLFRKLQGSVK